MGDIGRGLSSQLSTAPYLTGGHYARSPGTGGKFTAPLPLAIGAMSWALNTLQPSLGATATTSAEKLSVVKAEVAFAFLLFLWGAYWNYRGHVRRLGRRAYAESAYPWTGNGKPEDFPQRDWTTASEPPYGWSLLELASDHALDHTSVSDSVTHDPPSRVCRKGCSAGDSVSGGVNSKSGGDRICADDGRLRRISLFLATSTPLL